MPAEAAAQVFRGIILADDRKLARMRVIEDGRQKQANPTSKWSMSIIANHGLSRFLLLFVMAQATQLAIADSKSESDQRLAGKIDYWFVGHLGQTDDEGRTLVWEASIEGDLQGKMKWWFDDPPLVAETAYVGGRVSFYTARWELWANGELLLAGNSAGKTNFPDGTDGMWDGHGLVMDARGKFKNLEGRKIYESGPVILGSDPPKSLSGTGMFLVY